MASCKDCLHAEVCRYFPYNKTKSVCEHFKDRSRFVKQKTAVWVRNSPNLDAMREFHKRGIGKGMSENSVFWTCANCGVWGSPIYSFCPHCGAKIRQPEQALKEREA